MAAAIARAGERPAHRRLGRRGRHPGRRRRRSTSARPRGSTPARCGCRRSSRPSWPRVAVEAQTAWVAARAADAIAGFAPHLARMVELKRAEADCLRRGPQPLRRPPRRLRARDDRRRARAALRPPPPRPRRAPRPHRRSRAAGAGARRPLPARRPARARPPARRRLRLRLGGGAARPRRAPLVLGLGRRRPDHHAGRRGRPARVPLRHHPRGRPRGLRAGPRPGAGAAARGLERLDGRARVAVAALREPARPQPRLLRLALGGDARQPSATPALDGPEALWRAVNAVETGFIRTEADEVHYNLHVMLRFDLERALVAGDLAVADLEAAWNDRFAADFGRTVPDARNGVLQDVHWSVGLFGYFPTYTLGNIYAAELHAALRRDLPGPRRPPRRRRSLRRPRLARPARPPPRPPAPAARPDRRGHRPRARRRDAPRASSRPSTASSTASEILLAPGLRRHNLRKSQGAAP